ncbi:ATP-binding protein [Thalassospiraceae bacterium LMO-JJ14]|nr:ATP-binding protein [Thalassospiraceae bacterium LMO-JJ14]
MTLISQEVFDRIPTAVIIVDDRRRILHANQAAIDLVGDNALGRDLSLSLRHPNILDALDRVLKGAADAEGEISLPVPVARSMTFRIERLADAPLADASVATLVLNDVTSAKKAEQMRTDFVANVSHELRSPLTALIGFIETLRGPASDDIEARTRFLDIMHRESQRMARLIDDLLSLTRVEINEHVPPRKAVDVSRSINNVIEALEPQAAALNISFKVTCPPDLPKAIADSDQLHQVFRNLIENAIKYGRDNTSIDIVLKAVERIPDSARPGVSIAITDHGQGIPKELIPRLTERFFRVDEARSSNADSGIGSTGLGLAIVKHIISRHRGHLAAQSTLGEGSTFTVFIPTDLHPRNERL